MSDTPSAEPKATMATGTTHRSAKGKKLYAVRDKKGQFNDIQTYARAHGSGVKSKSAALKPSARKAKRR